MRKETSEELRGRLKLVGLEYEKYFGVTKACRELNICRRPGKLCNYGIGNRNTTTKADLDCIEGTHNTHPSPQDTS